MINVRLPYYTDRDSDSCEYDTVAVLETGEETIPLCEECLDKLMSDIQEIMEAIGDE